MKNTFLDQVKGSLIISCQALPDEPLHSSFIMSRMALAAKEAGAAGIRANSIVDIQAIQDEVDLPVYRPQQSRLSRFTRLHHPDY
ncbi:N-acylglucosamine-6-phosphate 2-epimerase [Lactiplantibacillus plantarum subsp. plantarum]|uniref:N-acylglucosamine-6-phosphate 2-epimerase n=1 Tax=Lactiplantibacillus plantarum subsp. plantarum TaxID=337330 RepID=A0A2S3U9S6_LACPN|nr:N-acylglucosamine-6-phosphate 2-epimerase [Lactiplantibacillus plantarum subsp. plantarum]